jgi:nicotinamide riboside transporter PnuC
MTKRLVYAKLKIAASLVLSIAGYLLGVVADANHDTKSTIFVAACLSKIFFFLLAVPLAYSAGKNIREESNAAGLPGLRLMSWITFGVALIHFSLFFQWPTIAAGNSRLPDGQITIDAAMFFIASMLMIAESWNSYKSKEYSPPLDRAWP